MIESSWTPRGMVLSELDVTPNPSARNRSADTRAMSSNDITTILTSFRSAPQSFAYGPAEQWISRQLGPLFDLPPNWDTYGARPITEVAASDARHLLLQLLNQDVTPPTVVPLPDGGVSLEWRRHSQEFAIELPGAMGVRGASAYFRDAADDAEWEDSLAAAMPRVLEILNGLVVER